MIRGVVFDLDDTLSDERDYVRSGFACVARSAGASAEEVTAIFDWLWAAFESGVRGDTFDRLLEAFPGLARRLSSRDLVATYRGHAPDIRLVPGFAEVLDEMRDRGLRLGVLSDGQAASQSAKAQALRLDRWFDPIVLTGMLGPRYAKPATAGFEIIARGWGEAGSTLAYVADNPEKDFAGPRQLGWITIRLRRPAQLRYSLEPMTPADRPDLEARTPAELLDRLHIRDARRAPRNAG